MRPSLGFRVLARAAKFQRFEACLGDGASDFSLAHQCRHIAHARVLARKAHLGFEHALDLEQGLLEAARNAGYLLGTEPRVAIASDPTLPRREVRVVAWHSGTALELTKGMPVSPDSGEPGPIRGFFLIIGGDRHFPLDRPVVNIGRRLDNQIILEDPHVSRTHAQLRWRDGRFVLFDLGSTSGTKVNGRPVKQHTLLPGDVITIGPVRMVYGEDPGGPPDSTPAYRAPFPPHPAGHQRTIIGLGDEEKTEGPE